MKKFFLFGPLLFGLLFTGLLTRTNEPFAFMMPLLIYLGAGILNRPDKISLKVARSLSADRVPLGATVDVSLKLTNEGPRLEELFLEDIVPTPIELVGGTSDLLTTLERGETLHLKYSLRAGRGYYRFQGVNVRTDDHLGLFSKSKLLRAEGRLIVLPHSVKLKSIRIKPRRTRVYSGLIPARSGGQGIDFFGVREHQKGDLPRLINWKATARHPHALFTNEFEQERVVDVGLILDARQRSYGRFNENQLFEHAVSATAALAESFLNDGNRVGMYNYGRVVDWTFPGYGKTQKERILRALIGAKLGEHMVFEKLEYLPVRLFPASSQLIFISPLLRDDKQTLLQLRARGYQVLVISPDRISFEQERLKPDPYIEIGKRVAYLDRVLMLNELRQADIQVLNWPVNIPFHNLVSSSLTRHPALYAG
ncbi:DUF58 domain-containing protein [Thermodesulfobacteriota bacterium]